MGWEVKGKEEASSSKSPRSRETSKVCLRAVLLNLKRGRSNTSLASRFSSNRYRIVKIAETIIGKGVWQAGGVRASDELVPSLDSHPLPSSFTFSQHTSRRLSSATGGIGPELLCSQKILLQSRCESFESTGPSDASLPPSSHRAHSSPCLPPSQQHTPLQVRPAISPLYS